MIVDVTTIQDLEFVLRQFSVQMIWKCTTVGVFLLGIANERRHDIQGTIYVGPMAC